MHHEYHSSSRNAPVTGSDPFDRFVADPFGSATPTPPTQPTPPVQPRRHGWLMHLLMCAPMLAVVAFLVLSGAAGGGAIGYALLCMAMMGAMMFFMNHGSNPGHRH